MIYAGLANMFLKQGHIFMINPPGCSSKKWHPHVIIFEIDDILYMIPCTGELKTIIKHCELNNFNTSETIVYLENTNGCFTKPTYVNCNTDIVEIQKSDITKILSKKKAEYKGKLDQQDLINTLKGVQSSIMTTDEIKQIIGDHLIALQKDKAS